MSQNNPEGLTPVGRGDKALPCQLTFALLTQTSKPSSGHRCNGSWEIQLKGGPVKLWVGHIHTSHFPTLGIHFQALHEGLREHIRCNKSQGPCPGKDLSLREKCKQMFLKHPLR